MEASWHERLWPREGLGVFLLTLALVVVVSAAVADAGWTAGLGVITTVGMGAFAIGFLIARSRLPIFLAHIFSLTIGLACAFRVTASLLPEPYTWSQRWAWMWYRMYAFGVKMVSGGTSDDNLVFILQMALLVWIITYLVVWSVYRAHQVWHAVILSGLLFLGALYYAPRNLTGYFIFYLFVALLLVIRFNLYLQEQIWRRAQVQFNGGEITFDFWRAGLALSLIVVALAWLVPAIPLETRSQALNALRAPWYDMEDRWSRLFTALHFRASPGADFSGQMLSLGGARDLSDTPVLEIVPSYNLRYWREVALDRYTGHGWVNSDETTVRFGADYPPIALVNYQSRLPVSHTVTVLIPNTAVLAMAGQPVWVSLPARARLSYAHETVAEGISYARSRLPFQSGDAYTVAGLQSTASVEQLRAAGTTYPEWVTSRYLQLPEGLPERVRQLAYTLAATNTNAYDTAAAVESYLRREITYNEKIDEPPADRDAVDYVLFELRQGYCDYFASAMVVMLRTLGIPARLAAGYAQGAYSPERSAFVVRQRDAHAWPEVFFPNYGWVEFEPTAAQPVIERPRAADAAAPPRDESARPAAEAAPPSERSNNMDRLEGGEADNAAGKLPGVVAWLGALALLAAVAAGIVWLKLRLNEAGLSRVEAVYLRMRRLAGWAGAAPHAWQTPYEHATTVAAVVPDGQALAWRVADAVTRERYAAQPFGEAQIADLAQAWRALRPRLARAALRRHLRKLVGRLPGVGN